MSYAWTNLLVTLRMITSDWLLFELRPWNLKLTVACNFESSCPTDLLRGISAWTITPDRRFFWVMLFYNYFNSMLLIICHTGTTFGIYRLQRQSLFWHQGCQPLIDYCFSYFFLKWPLPWNLVLPIIL